jgi:hypothetical protein
VTARKKTREVYNPRCPQHLCILRVEVVSGKWLLRKLKAGNLMFIRPFVLESAGCLYTDLSNREMINYLLEHK